MEGDNDNYYCDLGTCSGGAGGTSFAAPRWAAFMALVNQQATEVGSAPSGGLGFINPSIYSIGSSSNFSADFHDVTDGNNDTANQLVWYNAVSGYDLVTGWGSPNGQSLIDALAGAVVPGFWLTTAPPTLSIYQGTSGSAVVSVTDAGGFAGSVSLTASNLPTGVTASFNPTSTSGTSQLLLTANSSATIGTSTVKITGTSGTLTTATQVVLTISSPPAPPPPDGVLGSVNIGSTSSTTTQTLTIKTAGTLNNIAVLTQGTLNLDFANVGGGSCAVKTKYNAGATCTVKIAFSPKYAGTRYGAVVLTDKNGVVLSNEYLQGVGVGPQSTFLPGSETTIGTGLLSPVGVAIRGDRSVYVADYGNSTTHGALYLETFSNGSYTQTKLSCTFNAPAGVALDGSGTLYVADPGSSVVYKVSISGSTCTQTALGSGFSQPWGLAVDGNGNVYVADKGRSSVYKEALQTNGTYVQATVGSGWVAPLGVAVDGNGNVYVADLGIPGVLMETPSGSSYTQTPIGQGWTAPSGIAVDGAAGIYVSDAGNLTVEGGVVAAGVYKEVASGGSYLQMPISAGWTSPNGLAVDALGNVQVADGARGVYKEDLADPPSLTFANTASGSISSDSPRSVTVSNLGTAALHFSAVSYATDFSEASTVTDCTSSSSLNAGQGCTLSIQFRPTTALGGKTSLLLSESISITTNTGNVAGTRQALSVSGTEVLPGGSVNLTVSPDPSTAGSSITLTANVNGPNGGPVPTGTVTFYNGTNPLSGAISLTNGVATYSTASLTAGTYAISASYSGDSNYVGSTSNTISESILAAAGTAPIADTNLGTLNIGSSSNPIPLTITFAQAETLGGIAVLTRGAPNLDFTNPGGGTCTVGTAYNANAACTVNVVFSPQYPGTRLGAVVLTDNSGNVIGTGYLEGAGTGPQTSFLPGTVTSFSLLGQFNNSPYPQGVAVDATGTLYFADPHNAVVVKETWGDFNRATVGSGMTEPSGVALDGAGNVYVADRGNHAVYKETLSNGSYIQTVIGYGLSSPMGVAVDGLGNVYIADFGNGVTSGAVYMETFSNGSYTQNKIAGTLISPQSVAVDGNGNIFVADSANGNGNAAVYKLTPSNGTYVQSSIGYGWATPTGVAVDGKGNIFVTDDAYDLGEGFVAQETQQPDGTYFQSIIANSTSIPYPGGVAVDGGGNRYITDNFSGFGNVYQQDVTDPPTVSFAATQFGQTSSDSPKSITVQNAGNAVLTFSSLSYPTDFPHAPGVATDCTAQSSLQIGTSCTLTVAFEPGTPLSNGQSQSLAENLTITSNSLGASTQNMAVTGTEATPAVSVALTTSANVFVAGANVTFTATVTGQSGLPAPTGTVTFYSVILNGGNTALNTSPLSGNGTATYSTNSLAPAVYSVIATYSADQIYGSATSSAVIVNIIPNSIFGTENIGSTNSIPVTVTFSSNTTLGSIAVLTDGMPNLDFTNAGGGTCTTGTPYSSNSSCTVNISFHPTFSGTRRGALVIGDNNGNLLQTIYLQGTGIGPQVAFQPAAATSLFAEPSAPCAHIVDSSGDIYLSSISTNGTCGSINKFTPNGGTYAQSTVTSSALSSPIDIAVDGAGNVYIADTGNGRVLKETLFKGTYSESVIATGLYIPRAIAVDGHGTVYFAVGVAGNPGYYPYIYQETPALSGGYTQTVGSYFYLYDPVQMVVDDAGNLYVHDHNSNPYPYTREADVIWEVSHFYLVAVEQGASLNFIDTNGNVYVTLPPYNYKFVHSRNESEGWIATPVPTGGWGMDGSGNLYETVDNVVTKVNFASPPSLRFAQTAVGSKSSDSPQMATLGNIGNAPLTFSVPNSGTNPSVSANFALDASSTCPQINASGASSSLAINNSCTYAVNFTPTASGTINGAVIASDNALNAVGDTQTIPLSGSGTSGGAMIVKLTIGPGGVPQVVLPNQSPAGAGNSGNVWVDTTHRTFVLGGVYLYLDSQGNFTCTLYSQTQLTASPWPQFGTLYFTTEYYRIPWCGTTLFPFQVARYTWGSNQSIEQDPFTLQYSTQDGTLHNIISPTATLSRITVTPAAQSGSGSNPPLTATAILTNPPPGAAGYDWQIIGGNGAIVFSNGQETMSSTTNSIPVNEPNPTPTSVSFNIQVGVRYPTTVATATAQSDPLLYGPIPDVFCGAPATVDVWVNNTATTTDDITVLSPAVTIPVQLNMHSNPSCGPQTLTLSATPTGRISFSQTTFNLADGSTANAVITPLAASMSTNDITIAATVTGKQVGTAMMTVADVKIPAIRNGDTPTGMPDRIPPRVNTAVHVTVQPDLGTSGQTIHLIPKNNNSTNGDFTINGTTFQDITGTTDVQLQGTTQTAPTAAPGGGNASKLNLDAQVRGQDAVLSPGFSIAAVIQNLTETLAGPAPGYPNALGIQVNISYQSDSGSLDDLDQCQWSEQVQVDNETGSLTGLGGGHNSGYNPCNETGYVDTHSSPRMWLDNAALLPPAQQPGHQQLSQTHTFLDLRTGVLNMPITNSGYYILRDITLNGQTNTLQWTTSKMGASTTANGYSSQAGAGQASLTQQ